MKVRDKLRMSKNSYQTLYESAIAWGMQKVITIEQQQVKIEEENSELKEKNRQLETSANELQSKITYLEKHAIEKQHQKEQEYADQISVLKRANQHAKMQLDKIKSKHKLLLVALFKLTKVVFIKLFLLTTNVKVRLKKKLLMDSTN
jgi:chromosome segregation ATPase